MLSGSINLAETLGLLRVNPFAFQEMRHAGDGIERRAYLVRHIGEENTFRHVGGLGSFFGLPQCSFRLFAPGNIGQKRNEACRFIRFSGNIIEDYFNR